MAGAYWREAMTDSPLLEHQLQPGVQVGAQGAYVVEVHDEGFRSPYELGAGEGLF